MSNIVHFPNGPMPPIPEMPTVRRVTTDTGSHIEPALDPDADPLNKLLWHAAVVAHDTGLRIRINPGISREKIGRRWSEVEPCVTVQVANGGTVLNYRDALNYLNGIDAGARATQGREHIRRARAKAWAEGYEYADSAHEEDDPPRSFWDNPYQEEAK